MLILLEVVKRLPKKPILHYNLTCYECQPGDLEVAKARLAHALKVEPKCGLMALDDKIELNRRMNATLV